MVIQPSDSCLTAVEGPSDGCPKKHIWQTFIMGIAVRKRNKHVWHTERFACMSVACPVLTRSNFNLHSRFSKVNKPIVLKIWKRSKNILKYPTEHFTEDSAEILAESSADIVSYCLIDLFNERPDLNFFDVFFAPNVNPVKSCKFGKICHKNL